MQHIGEALKTPVLKLAEQAGMATSADNRSLLNQADEIVRLVDEIQLLNLLETESWKTMPSEFSIQEVIDEVVPQVLPAAKRKGLQLLVKNQLAANESRYGDRAALKNPVDAVAVRGDDH